MSRQDSLREGHGELPLPPGKYPLSIEAVGLSASRADRLGFADQPKFHVRVLAMQAIHVVSPGYICSIERRLAQTTPPRRHPNRRAQSARRSLVRSTCQMPAAPAPSSAVPHLPTQAHQRPRASASKPFRTRLLVRLHSTERYHEVCIPSKTSIGQCQSQAARCALGPFRDDGYSRSGRQERHSAARYITAQAEVRVFRRGSEAPELVERRARRLSGLIRRSRSSCDSPKDLCSSQLPAKPGICPTPRILLSCVS